MCLNGKNICKSPSTSCIFCCVNFTQRVSSRRQATTTKTGPENGLVKKTCRSQSNKPCSKCLLRNWMFLKHTQTMENNFEFLLKWTVGRYQTNLSQNQKSPLPIPTNIWTMTPVQRRFIHSNFLLSTIWMIFPYDFPVWFSIQSPLVVAFHGLSRPPGPASSISSRSWWSASTPFGSSLGPPAGASWSDWSLFTNVIALLKQKAYSDRPYILWYSI